MHRFSYLAPLLLGFALIAFAAQSVGAALRTEVVDPAAVRAAGALSTDGSELEFVSRDGVRLSLLMDADDASIVNPFADGSFRPFPASIIERALGELRLSPDESVLARIYLLPGLPQEARSSFAVGAEIFLAPALGPWPEEVASYTFVHELGHVIQNRFAPGRRGAAWERYLRLRGLRDATIYHDRAAHRDRPGEIFAEDFRALFGGALATSSATIENPNLPTPASVGGLRAFFVELLAGAYEERPLFAFAENYPNPFNPTTVIRARLDEATARDGVLVDAIVYDVRGRVVKRLGKRAAEVELRIPWNGTDDAGRVVASGRYVYRLSAVGQMISGSMLLMN